MLKFQGIFSGGHRALILLIGKSFLSAALIICCLIKNSYCDAKTDSEIVTIGNFHVSDIRQGTPEGWQLVRYKGAPVLMIRQDVQASFLRMVSNGRTAFGIKKEISVDVRNHPYLHWSWKALQLPAGGDIRHSSRDDQALQVYIIFPGTGFPELYTSPAIAYIWDNESPKGLMTRSPQKSMGFVRYIVVKNKADALGIWYRETRNILEDYRNLFPDVNCGVPPGPVRAMMLFINTHHTGSKAEGCFSEIYFSKTGRH